MWLAARRDHHRGGRAALIEKPKPERTFTIWLTTTCGFFSIHETPDDAASGTLTVRGRVQSDIDDLRSRYLPELTDTKIDTRADYWFRGRAPREAVARAIGAMALDITYPSFKDAVGRVQGLEREAVYLSAWTVFRRLQQPPINGGLPIIFAGIGRRPDILGQDDDENGSSGL